MQVDYDIRGRHWRCQCGCMSFEIRMQDHKYYLKNNDGGVLELHCEECGKVSLMSDLLGLTAKWLRAEAAAGRIPCLRAGKRFLFDREAVINTLAKRARDTQKAEHV